METVSHIQAARTYQMPSKFNPISVLQIWKNSSHWLTFCRKLNNDSTLAFNDINLCITKGITMTFSIVHVFPRHNKFYLQQSTPTSCISKFAFSWPCKLISTPSRADTVYSYNLLVLWPKLKRKLVLFRAIATKKYRILVFYSNFSTCTPVALFHIPQNRQFI